MNDADLPSGSALARRTIRKVSRRLLPLVALSYLIAYIDRTNVAFAALTMNQDVGLSSTICGLGAGFFFIGYALFEVPSNVVLERVGARRWIALINSPGNLGGYVGPFIVGWIRQSTESFEIALYFLAACAATSALVTWFATRSLASSR